MGKKGSWCVAIELGVSGAKFLGEFDAGDAGTTHIDTKQDNLIYNPCMAMCYQTKTGNPFEKHTRIGNTMS